MSSRKKTVKNIFIFFLCYLPLQYALVGILGYYKAEPWPAFVFPGFKNVFVYNDQYAVNNFYLEVSHTGENQPSDITLQEFFDDIPISMLAGFMRSNLSDQATADNFSDETRSWLADRAEARTGFETDQINLVHERLFKQRKNRELQPDSTEVISRIQLYKDETVYGQ
jgi:hypothetical protein